jgi:agmatine/peptidylarginine deiminase
MKQLFTLMMLIMIPGLSAVSQDNSTVPTVVLRHEMTPEEALRKGEIGKDFVETNPPAAPVRNVAEFDRMQGALVRYPFGIPLLLIKEMATDIMVTTIVASTSQKNTVISQYTANGINLNHCNFLIAATDSYWTRDYGPWFESDSSNQVGIVDFPYNRPRPNDDEIPKKVATMLGIPWFGMNLIHTGGNYMTTGYSCSSSTQLVWEENPTQSHPQVSQKMHDYLGIENYYVRPDPNGTYIDHIDCWGKFLGPDKILIRKVQPSHAQYSLIQAAAAFWSTTNCSYGYPYKVYRVNTPQDQPYTNSVILNNKVLVPVMNSSWDDSALAVYQAAMPGYEVIGFVGNSSTPWESTDALHCRVMGIADLGILFVKHNPIWGLQSCTADYVINADIIACSDSAVKSDSVLIWYKVNNGNFQAVSMDNTSENHYTGIIPMQPAGSIVRYYVFAADRSNRRATAPFIGGADPFAFSTADFTGMGEPAQTTALGNSYPNPFSSVAVIPLEIKQRGNVTLEILDIRGSLVKILVSEVLDPGITNIQWDGTDTHGNKLPGGIYLYRLTSENKVETSRMVFIP